MKRHSNQANSLPNKANRILNGILIVLLLIVFKIWHLAVIQHDDKVEESQKPQRRTVIDRSERAMICDRFGIPLATNNVQYNAAVSYGPIRDIPRSVWRRNEEGKREKILLRKEYIKNLAALLAGELRLDGERVEDLIHSKAAILGNVPCVIKENITEQEYFRLNMLEKDWPGIQTEYAAKRSYPLNRVGAEVIGFIGAISKNEYEAATREMRELRQTIARREEGDDSPLPNGFASIEEIEAYLIDLEKRTYSINDHVGKMGVEASFDAELRGLRGKRLYLADIRGNYLREIEGSEPPVSGSPLRLTLSSELQEYAEKLLIEFDQASPSQSPAAVQKKDLIPEHQPWIKGGAIVVIEPQTGEVLTLASFPRFNPNDFIRSGSSDENGEKNSSVSRWLETENYLASIWNLKKPLERERFDPSRGIYFEDSLELGWNEFLNFILPQTSPVKQALERFGTLHDAFFILKKVDQMLRLFESNTQKITPAKIFNYIYHDSDEIGLGVTISLQEKEFFEEKMKQVQQPLSQIKEDLSPYFNFIPMNYEKILLVDLYRLAVDERRFSPKLVELLGSQTIEEFREASARFVSLNDAAQEIMKSLFHENHFKKWRESSFQEFLTLKRKEERAAKKKYAKPYIEYLDEEERRQFNEFWNQNRWEFLSLFLGGSSSLLDSELNPYLFAIKTWEKELNMGAHCALSWVPHYHQFKKIVEDFETPVLKAYLKTLRGFKDLNRPLLGNYIGIRNHAGVSLEKDLASAFYPTYGFGYARSHAFRQAVVLGSIFKLVPAYEALRQRYQIHPTGELNPLTIVDDKQRVWGKKEAWNVGYTLDGKAIPMFYHGGRLPRSEHSGIGRVDLIHALEASSNPYFAMLAGDILEDPDDLCKAANSLGFGEKTGIDLPGEFAGKIPKDVVYNRTGLYAMSIGQHSLVGTPLQTACMLAALANGGNILKPSIISQRGTEAVGMETRWRVFLPRQIQNLLLTGMRQVIMGEKGTARFLRSQYPAELIQQVIGKTSTAEAIEHFSLDGTSGRLKTKHIWFGAIAYESGNFSKPELVVVVYLRHGDFGRNAAPLAMEIIKKWREIKQLHTAP